MYIKTMGLVLRETLYKESSKMLTVLTSEQGKIGLLARGARRRGSRTGASAQLLSYSEITYLEGKTGRVLTEARCIEMFEGLRSDLSLLSLASYFAEVLETISEGDGSGPEILQLGLNSLYALSSSICAPEIVKAAFEVRAMCISGYAPALEACAVCGREDAAEPRLNLGGVIRCKSCLLDGGGPDLELCSGSLAALRYIANAEPKKIFSFKIGSEAIKRLSRSTEAYLLSQLDRGFKTLDFYKSLYF